jgi:Carbohydrate-binding module 48 (Isoamylase N-terminal domain)
MCADHRLHTYSHPSPIGASFCNGGVNFSLYSRNAQRVELLFFDRGDDSKPSRIGKGSRNGAIPQKSGVGTLTRYHNAEASRQNRPAQQHTKEIARYQCREESSPCCSAVIMDHLSYEPIIRPNGSCVNPLIRLGKAVLRPYEIDQPQPEGFSSNGCDYSAVGFGSVRGTAATAL